MSELVRQRDETVLVVAARCETVHATATRRDGKSRSGGDHIVGCELKTVGDGEPQHVLARPEREPGEPTLDDATTGRVADLAPLGELEGRRWCSAWASQARAAW